MSENKILRKRFNLLFQIILIIILGFIGALNYQLFVFPNSFAPAGINGIATMIQYLFQFSVGSMSLIVNIPLFIVTFFFCDKEFAWKNMIYVLSFSLCLLLFKYVIDIEGFVFGPELVDKIININGEEVLIYDYSSKILGPITAGVINGFIYGTSIKMNSSTGGTDYIAKLIKNKKPQYNFVWIIFILNAVVAFASYFVYGYKFGPVVCCILYCFTTSFVSDSIIKGGKAAIKFEVITNNPEELSREIIQELKHDATVMNAQGMYTHKEKTFLICIINKNQVVDFQRILNRYPGSFAYMSSVNETLGNFKKIK